MELELARDVLDQEILDRNGEKMGRIDGVVIIVDENGPPRVDRFELGFVVLALRIHPVVEKWLHDLRKWSVRKEAVQVIPWSQVEEVTDNHVKVAIEAGQTEAFAWERFLSEKVVSKIPGSGAKE